MSNQTFNKKALNLWQFVLRRHVHDFKADLSNRQMAIMLEIYLNEDPISVTQLSERLEISKPAVSRALDAMSQKGYVRRRRDAKDRRKVWVRPTVAGSVFLSDFSASIVESMRQLGSA